MPDLYHIPSPPASRRAKLQQSEIPSREQSLARPQSAYNRLLSYPRFWFRTFAACFPSAVRVDFGRCAIVRFRFAARAALGIFLRAAALCFRVAITPPAAILAHAKMLSHAEFPVEPFTALSVCFGRIQQR